MWWSGEQDKRAGRGLYLFCVLWIWFRAAFSSCGGKTVVKTTDLFSPF